MEVSIGLGLGKEFQVSCLRLCDIHSEGQFQEETSSELGSDQGTGIVVVNALAQTAVRVVNAGVRLITLLTLETLREGPFNRI